MTKSKANPTLPMFCSNCVSFFLLIFFSFVSSILQNCQKEFEMKKKVMFGFSCSMKFSHAIIHVKSNVRKTPPLLVSPSFAFSSFWRETLCVSEKLLLHLEKEHDLEDYKMCVEMTLGIQKVVKLKIGEAYKEGDKSWRMKKIPFKNRQHKTIFFHETN